MSRSATHRLFEVSAILTVLALVAACRVAAAADNATAVEQADSIETGREIFQREWLPNDPRSHGGDGLGPVFNDSSCIGCHNQGGAGGGGPASRNVDIVSAILNNPSQLAVPKSSLLGSVFQAVGLSNPDPSEQERRKGLDRRRRSLLNEAKNLHPGFLTSSSVVIHKSGIDADYQDWRQDTVGGSAFGAGFGMLPPPATTASQASVDIAVAQAEAAPQMDLQQVAKANEQIQRHRAGIQAQQFATFPRHHGNFTLISTQRNPTALFGAGLIDSISDDVIKAAAKRTIEGFPEVKGRVCRLPNDEIGRFGWKAQKASLHDFTITACAVELGLHVPEHPQSGDPLHPEFQPAGFDLTRAECNALVDYLKRLPKPQTLDPINAGADDYLSQGQQLFASVGCASCHTEQLGEVDGIYSDLLLHDMGEDLGDTGDYGVFIPDSPGGEAQGVVPPLMVKAKQAEDGKAAGKKKQDVLGATRLEWRTPPLWGLRDSAPYMHDGRAATLEQAIAFHGGEATRITQRFFALPREQQRQVIAFLKSMVAPDAVASR